MAKHRAVIVGAGRIGAGYNWPGFPYIYTHADAYLALRERVELVGFVDPDPTRAGAACKKYGIRAFTRLSDAMNSLMPNIVSVCTPDATHGAVFRECQDLGIRNFWMEKPFSGIVSSGVNVQVNLCRRFDETHQAVAKMVKGKKSNLFVWARADLTTSCHFEDLVRWWGSELIYMDNTGESPSTNSYRLETGKWGIDFRNGGVAGDFMVSALLNLLDVADGVPGAELLSPPYEDHK